MSWHAVGVVENKPCIPQVLLKTHCHVELTLAAHYRGFRPMERSGRMKENKLTAKAVEHAGLGMHGDGNGLWFRVVSAERRA